MQTCRVCGAPLLAAYTLGNICQPCVDKVRIESSGGLKFDSGKLRYSLIPPEATKALATVLSFGANKYAPNSWQTVPNARERYLDALMRHLEAYRSGELTDNESGLPHIDHLLCNAAFLSYFASKDSHGN